MIYLACFFEPNIDFNQKQWRQFNSLTLQSTVPTNILQVLLTCNNYRDQLWIAIWSLIQYEVQIMYSLIMKSWLQWVLFPQETFHNDVVLHSTLFTIRVPLVALLSSTRADKVTVAMLGVGSYPQALTCSHTRLSSLDFLHTSVSVCDKLLAVLQSRVWHPCLSDKWLGDPRLIQALKKHLLPILQPQPCTCSPIHSVTHKHSSPHQLLIRDITARWQVWSCSTCKKSFNYGRRCWELIKEHRNGELMMEWTQGSKLILEKMCV